MCNSPYKVAMFPSPRAFDHSGMHSCRSFLVMSCIQRVWTLDASRKLVTIAQLNFMLCPILREILWPMGQAWTFMCFFVVLFDFLMLRGSRLEV